MDAGISGSKSVLDADRTCGHVLSVSGSQAAVGLAGEKPRSRQRSLHHGRQIPAHPACEIAAGRHGDRSLAGNLVRGARPGLHRDRAPRHDGRDQAARRRQAFLPARRHRLSGDRRSGGIDHARRVAPDLRYLRLRHDRHRTPATGPLDRRLHQCRRDAEQAFRRARHHRCRQIERRCADPAADSRCAAESPAVPARRPQRVCALLRRPRAGAQSAQSETAVLAVQFRRDRRRLFLGPPRRGRGGRGSEPN